MKTRIAILTIVLGLLAAACGGGDASGTDDNETTTTGADTTGQGDGDTTTTIPTEVNGSEVVLVITDGGGFVPVEFLATQGPRYVLTADGSLYAMGPVPEIFPGPLVQPYVVIDASDSLDDIYSLVEGMGLAGIDEEVNDDAGDFIADASTTGITFYDEDGAHKYAVYALGVDERADDEMVQYLRDIVMTLDAIAMENEGTPYEPTQWQVSLSEVELEGVETSSEDWPLEVAPHDFVSDGDFFPCLVVEADPTLDAAFEAASQQVTTWDYEGDEYYLLVRVLLPGETGCEPLF